MIKTIYRSIIIAALCCSTSCSMIRKSDRTPNSDLEEFDSHFVNKTDHMEFKNGKKEGSGVLYYIDGSFEEGKWEDDSFVYNNQQDNDINQIIEIID